MRRFVIVLALVALGTVACTSSGSDAGDGGATATSRAEPTGPAADVVDQLLGGNGIFLGSASTEGLPPDWVETEYAVEGRAVSYASDGELPTNGRFSLREDDDARYTTRIVVRRPRAASDFSGTVVVEWLNVSGGVDANPDWEYLRNAIVRRGDAWVGVSAQLIGVEGGPVAVSVPAAEEAGAGKGLRGIDPERYGSLHHPGDAFSYDIFTQVARLVREPDTVLGPLRPDVVLAVGESQSAFMLTTYVDGVQPLTQVFDGFLIHSRGGAAAPLGAPGEGIDVASSIGGPPTSIRTDGDAPVMVVETETDVAGVLGALAARQDDDDHLRWWEIAGAAHADRFIVGELADSLGCGKPVNDGPGRFPVRAALVALDAWVRDGTPPPTAPRLDVDSAGALVRDEWGIATGGIRTPLVDVPVDVLSGAPAGDSIVCILFGSTTPFTDAQLRARYDSRDDYLEEYAAAADAAIEAGFVLPADRSELMAASDPDRVKF